MTISATWNDAFTTQWLGSDRDAVVTEDEVWGGDELVQRAAGAGGWLEAHGHERGAGVPALLDESPTAIALVVGGALVGRPLAPLGTRLGVADLSVAARAFGGAGLVTTPEHAQLGAEVARAAEVPLHVLEGAPRAAAITGTATPDDVALIVHTSGTTGAPKAVRFGQRELAARLDVYEHTMPIGPGDLFSSASPMHHTAGVTMLLTVLGRGAAVVPQAWFSIDGWRAAGRLGVTHAVLVPTMIDLLLEAGALGDARPRVLQYGAAPIDRATLTDALRALPDVEFMQIFGQTEVSPLTALMHADHLLGLGARPELLGTVGRAVPGVELRIERPDDDGIGEIAALAPHAMVRDDDGWHRTGDLGAIDSHGYVTLHGRVDDRIIRGGENIYPTEVEAALASHPAVREVGVCGVPDRRYGEVVKAVIVAANPSVPPSADDLKAHARQRLAPFKVPSVIEIVDALPRNANGKVVRRLLSDLEG